MTKTQDANSSPLTHSVEGAFRQLAETDWLDNEPEVMIPFPGLYNNEPEGLFSEEETGNIAGMGGVFEDALQHFYCCADYRCYHVSIAKAYTEKFFADLQAAGTKKFMRFPKLDYKFVEMDSPREYNYLTDRIFVTMPKKTLGSLWSLMRRQPGLLSEFEDTIRKRFTSRSGFVSFYPDKPEEWYTPGRYKQFDHNEWCAVLTAFMTYLLPEDWQMWALHSDEVDELRYEVSFGDDADAVGRLLGRALSEYDDDPDEGTNARLAAIDAELVQLLADYEEKQRKR